MTPHDILRQEAEAAKVQVLGAIGEAERHLSHLRRAVAEPGILLRVVSTGQGAAYVAEAYGALGRFDALRLALHVLPDPENE